MKQLEKSDLKIGEVYKNVNGDTIFLCQSNKKNYGDGFRISTKIFARNNYFDRFGIDLNFLEATPEEKHWLETCIEADKFVSYEEAMKTFIPEYVECVSPEYWSKTIKQNNGNLIFKSDFKSTCEVQIIDMLRKQEYHAFKPSTKEAYDAQFKEPEFVLPETWCIKLTNENQETVINYINQNTKDGVRHGNIGMYYGYNGEHCTSIFNLMSTTEITFDQFKQHVLKENTTVTEKPKVVFEKPKDKVIKSHSQGKIITEVQCSEGGIYKIGDKITVFDKTSPNKGKPFTIQGFRWNNAKTKLCAVTELHTPNGIGLDKIELYLKPKVEPKQELSLLEQAKLKYPVGTKIISPTSKALFTIKGNIRYGFPGSCTEDCIFGNDGECSLYLSHENKWAEIVEDFVLPEKWCIRLNLENVNIVGKWFNENSQTRIYDYHKLTLDKVSTIYNILHYPAYKYLGLTKHGDTINKIKNGYTEITFEQFKKYILNETL